MMAKQSLICRDDPRMTRQQHPLADRYFTKKLKDLVGPDSMTFFERYGVIPTFLTAPASSWDDNKDYQTLSVLVRGTSVVNDCAERAFSLSLTVGRLLMTRGRDRLSSKLSAT